jgi:hypothetical protein
MFSSSAATVDEFETTVFCPLTIDKMAGLFSEMIRSKAADQYDFGTSQQTGYGDDFRREKVSELTAEWKQQEISILIDQFVTSNGIKSGERIRSRLLSLREMVHEEEEGDADISPDSLRAFLTLLHQIPDARHPDITLTPGGMVYARWKGELESLFAVQFLTDEKVRFVVFRRNDHHSRLVNRFSGVDAVDTVLETANNACSVFDWILG